MSHHVQIFAPDVPATRALGFRLEGKMEEGEDRGRTRHEHLSLGETREKKCTGVNCAPIRRKVEVDVNVQDVRRTVQHATGDSQS